MLKKNNFMIYVFRIVINTFFLNIMMKAVARVRACVRACENTGICLIMFAQPLGLIYSHLIPNNPENNTANK